MSAKESQSKIALNLKLLVTMFLCMLVVHVNKVASEELSITDIDFDVDPKGQALVTITGDQIISGATVSVSDSQIEVIFQNTNLPADLDKRLDVSDFSTPIGYIDSEQQGARAIIQISNRKSFTYKTE